MRKLLSLIALTFLLAACGQQAPTAAPTAAANPPTAAPVATTPPSPTDTTSPTAAPASPYPGPAGIEPYPAPSPAAGATTAPAELVSAASERLAKQLGIDVAKLQLVRAEAKQWPDGALGCPEPGKAYDQYAIPGYLLAFSDGTREYALHTSLAANPGEPMLLCDNQKPIDLSTAAVPAVPGPEAQAMAEVAKQALATALSIDPATITVVSVTPVEWNDSSLGCPKPDQTYIQVITPGYMVRLEAAGKGYEYHTDTRNQAVQCTP